MRRLGSKEEGKGKAGEAPEGQGGAILRLQTFRHRRIDARCAGKAPDSQKLQIRRRGVVEAVEAARLRPAAPSNKRKGANHPAKTEKDAEGPSGSASLPHSLLSGQIKSLSGIRPWPFWPQKV